MSVELQQHCVFWIYLQGLHFIDDRLFDAERMLNATLHVRRQLVLLCASMLSELNNFSLGTQQ